MQSISGTNLLYLVVAFGLLLDFAVGKTTKAHLARLLEEFEMRILQRDWTYLFRTPASIVYASFERVLGGQILSIRYVWRVAVTSMLLSSLYIFLIMALSYLYWMFAPIGCGVPSLLKFVGIFLYTKTFIVQAVAVGVFVDAFFWTASRLVLFRIATSRKIVSYAFGAIAVAMSALMFFIVSAIYLPLGIKVQANMMGLPFNWSDYLQIFKANFFDAASVLQNAGLPFYIDCKNDQFSISLMGTWRLMVFLSLLPMALFFLLMFLAVLAVVTRPLSKNVLAFFVRRLHEGGNPIMTLFGVLVAAIATIADALAK